MNEKAEVIIRKAEPADTGAVTDIFNYYVRESFAAYPDEPVGNRLFADKMKALKLFYVLELEDKIAGFAYLDSYRHVNNFNHTGVLTYFLHPDYTGRGLGKVLMDKIIQEGRAAGITNYIAHISSHNKQSLDFHKKHGFEEAGRLRKIGKKFGEYFDVVWVQKITD